MTSTIGGNPYTVRLLSYLGERDPLEVLSQTPGRLRALRQRIGVRGLEKSAAAGKWTSRQIFAHLADVEIAFGFRIRQVLAEADHRIQPFDQDAWARRYSDSDPEAAVEAFGALRSWNLALLRGLGPQELARKVFHPERGEETLDLMIRMLAGHDLNHTAPLESIAAATEAHS